MKRFRLHPCVIYTSDRTRTDAVWDAQLLLRGFFQRRKLWQMLIHAHSLGNHLRRTPIILSAHGKTDGERWCAAHGNGRYQPVQDWIDEHDGESGALLLFCCNSRNQQIASQKSLVIHLDRAVSRLDLFRGGCLRLFHPQFGYIGDNYYRIHQLLGSS